MFDLPPEQTAGAATGVSGSRSRTGPAGRARRIVRGMRSEVPPLATGRDRHCGERFRLRLRAEPRGFAVVRRQVRAQLLRWDREDLTYSAAMCVTELLSNVHKHVASPECELTLLAIEDGVRAAVADGDPRLPVAGEPDFRAESGRGLFLLSQMVDDWGAEATSDGKQVWFELRR